MEDKLTHLNKLLIPVGRKTRFFIGRRMHYLSRSNDYYADSVPPMSEKFRFESESTPFFFI